MTEHNHDIEQALLGAMMRPEVDFGAILSTVSAADFSHTPYRLVFEAVCALHDRGDQPDEFTLPAYLDQAGHLPQCGGVAGIVEIQDSVLSAAQAPHYARLVLESANRRRAQEIAQSLIEAAGNGSGDLVDICTEAQDRLAALHHGRVDALQSIEAAATETLSRLDRYKLRLADDVIPTPFSRLNDMLGGGLRRHHYTIVAARPSMGKTTFAHNVAAGIAVAGIPVGIVSLEMSAIEIVERIACAMAQVNGNLLRSGRVTDEEFNHVASCVGRIAGLPIHIDDSPTMTDSQFRAQCSTLAKRGCQVVILDYLQLLSSAAKAENRQQEVTRISRAIMIAARESDVSILALSQLSREPEKRTKGRPGLADLRDSGSLEQDANNVLMLYWPHKNDQSADPNRAELIVEKQRNGPTGIVNLAWFRDQVRFATLAEDPDGWTE